MPLQRGQEDAVRCVCMLYWDQAQQSISLRQSSNCCSTDPTIWRIILPMESYVRQPCGHCRRACSKTCWKVALSQKSTEPGYGDLPRCSNKCERESGAEAATSHTNPVHQIAMCLDARSKNRPFRNNHRSVPAF